MARTTPTTDTRRLPARNRAAVAKILPSDARIHHRALVLQHLYDGGPASRADLSRLTKLARVTVSDVVSDLINDDLVSELGVRPGTHMGKPAKLIGVNVTGGYLACLDLSNDAFLRGALLDLEGTVVDTRQVQINGDRGEDAVLKTLSLARELVAASPGRVLGVGVGSPGVVTVDGVILRAPNLGWTEVDLRTRLMSDLGLPAYVANDADTGALAEDTFGQSSGSGMLLVEISHGVGAGILLDGTLLRGPDSTAGEIGHVTAVRDGLECPCGRRGCLETILSVPSLRARVADLSPEETEAALADVGRQFGKILAPVTQALGVRDVVLSGPEEFLSGPLLQAAQDTVLALTRPFGTEQIKLRMSALGADGVLIGAAALVLDGELGVS